MGGHFHKAIAGCALAAALVGPAFAKPGLPPAPELRPDRAPAAEASGTPPAPAEPDASAQSAQSTALPGRTSRGSRGLPSIRGAQPGPEGFNFALGAGVLIRPRYLGSNAYETDPIPAFSLGYDDWLFVDPASGAGVRQQLDYGVTVSGGADYGAGRKESDDLRLQGLGDLDGGVTAFGEIEWQPFQNGIGRAISFELGAETPLTGDIDGLEVTADVAVSFPLANLGYGTINGGAIFADGVMMDDLFSVTPAQAAASALPAYDASGGLRAYSLGFTALTPLGGAWTMLVTSGYERLVNDAADSPISETNNQYTVAAGILYTFD